MFAIAVPIIEEKVRLLVKPMCAMIEESKRETLSTRRIDANHDSVTSKIVFQLRISTGCDLSNSRKIMQSSSSSISANLYLLSDAIFPEFLLFRATLSISLAKKKKCISEHSSMLDLPTADVSDCETNKEETVQPLCVASFPNILSHRFFKHDNLVNTPHLNINLCVHSLC